MPQVTFGPVKVTAREVSGSITYYIDGKLIAGVGATIPLASLADYAQGSIIRGGAVDWEAYAAETAGAVLIGDGTDIVSDTTPTLVGLLTLGAGLTFSGASGANNITIPDNAAIAAELLDAGGLEYLRIVTTNAQPVVNFNSAAADVDFHVEASGAANALFVRGSDGFVGLGTNAPDGTLHVHTATAGAVAAIATDLVVESDTGAGISILTPAADTGVLLFGSPTHAARGGIAYDHATDTMYLNVVTAPVVSLTDNSLNVLTGNYITMGDATTIGQAAGPLILFDDTGDDLEISGCEVLIDPGAGLAAPDGTLHVHTATAGAVVASALADDLIVENNTSAGVSILTPDANTASIYFGSPNDPVASKITWNATSTIFNISTTGVIDFTLAAALDFRISANSLGVLSGSAISMADGCSIGITSNELLTFNAAGTIAASGITGISVENGDWVGAGSSCAWLFDSANVDITTGALVGIGTGVPANPVAQCHVVGAAASGLPVMILNQTHDSEEYIDFLGNSSTGVGQPITTWTAGNSIQGFVRVGINGSFYWMPYYDAPSS